MRKPANVQKAMHLSFAVTVSAAALILSGAEGSRWPAAFTPVVAAFAYVFVDRRKLIRLPVAAANTLGVLAFIAMSVEFYGNTLLGKLFAGSHLLVYMTWVVLLMRKGIRQLWWLAALSILQVSVASVLTSSPTFGAALILMLLIMIWTLGVFTLYRAQVRLHGTASIAEDSLSDRTTDTDDVTHPTVRNGMQFDPEERWIGLRFCGTTSFTFTTSLVIGIIAFAVFPRFWVNQPLAAMSTIRQALPQQTGFTDTVTLGEIGQIMQSDQRVLQFEITDIRTGTVVDPDEFASAMHLDEVMFRGNALGTYHNGKWSSGNSQGTSVGDLEQSKSWFNRNSADADFRLRITQDPPIATFVFAPMPAVNAINREGRGHIGHRRLSYSLIHQISKDKHRDEPLAYEIWCKSMSAEHKGHTPARFGQVAHEIWERDNSSRANAVIRQEQMDAQQRCITRHLPEKLPRLAELASGVCTIDQNLMPEAARVERISDFLSFSGGFTYTLNASIQDPAIDPIEDFLFNRKSGHCEYFASAGALMLQAVDVPARVVNGYKGCELNSVTGRWEVKQKHAHTWIEAFVDGRWVTVDPTPSARDESVNRGAAFGWWTNLRTAVADSWYNLVQKMSLQQQQAMVRPLLDSAKQTWTALKEQGLLASLKQFYTEVILQPQKWFRWQVGAVTFVLLLGMALLLRRRPDKVIKDFLLRLRGLLKPQKLQQQTVVRFYDNFRTLCGRHGLVFPASTTANENAALAVDFFQQHLLSDSDRQIPLRIAGAYNVVRFGGTALAPEKIGEIRDDIVRLGRILNNPPKDQAAVGDNSDE